MRRNSIGENEENLKLNQHCSSTINNKRKVKYNHVIFECSCKVSIFSYTLNFINYFLKDDFLYLSIE